MNIEVQIRTALQHSWAELSEKLSDIFEPTIKYGGGAEEIRAVLAELSDRISYVEISEMRLLVTATETKRQEFRQLKQNVLESFEQMMAVITRQ